MSCILPKKEGMVMRKFEKVHTLEISQPISRNVFSAATALWVAGQAITEDSLSQACGLLKVKATSHMIRDMVALSDLLNRICPA